MPDEYFKHRIRKGIASLLIYGLHIPGKEENIRPAACALPEKKRDGGKLNKVIFSDKNRMRKIIGKKIIQPHSAKLLNHEVNSNLSDIANARKAGNQHRPGHFRKRLNHLPYLPSIQTRCHYNHPFSLNTLSLALRL